jgi:nucleoporin SEH1
MLAIGCGKEHVAKIYRQDLQSRWQACEVLSGHGGVVRDVAWAPVMGRSYHLLATACSDGHVRIFHLNPVSKQGKQLFNVELVADFADHQSEVWQVEWNITGTVLSSSADDGTVRLWRSSALKEWKQVGTIGSEKQ